ncbi:MAG: hypothetical protein U0V72_09230 [Cytophagales bacterium]
MTRLFILILLTFIFGCKENTNKTNHTRDRDSIMTKYFQTLDSLPYSDTLDLNLKLLKAYHNNDTGYLKKQYFKKAELLKYRKKLKELPACEEPIPINKLNFEESYRFNYGAAFCDKVVTITIGKFKNEITLDFYLYQVNNEQTKCKTIRHTIKQVDNKVWEELKKGIAVSDFWGLEEDNGRYGLDGSSLCVIGYERPINDFEVRYKMIYRWAAEDMVIGQLFKRLLDLSGNKVDCFHY